jgi:hypothetical protein
MNVAHIKVMVQIAARVEYAEHQSAVLRALLHRLFNVDPREVQLRVVRRLIYGIGDTLLIARTGFGKSLTFQAVCALTDKVAIQLVPLSKLGHQQASRMARIAGARACLITAETLERDDRLLLDVQRCKYNHILLGPEQAVAPRFRRILRDPDFAKNVGVVIVDECHVLSTWGTFRESVTHIRELRLSLPSRVRMYGCTATLTEEQEKEVLKYGGFRQEGDGVEDLRIIRVSIDRPEISLRVRPIERGMSTSYRQLYFVLHGAVQDTSAPEWFQFGRVYPEGLETLPGAQRRLRFRCSPRRIPKTIVFVDGISKIETVVELMRQWLQELGYSPEDTRDVVCSYSSHTSRFDQDAIIDEFEKPDSNLRIIVATSAIGMGMELGEVKLVVQFGLPLGQGIDELWQRFGRLARVEGSTGVGVLFAPYWLFDCMGRFPQKNPVLNAAGTAAVPISQHQRGKSRVHEASQDARKMQRRSTLSSSSVAAPSSRLREQPAAASANSESDGGDDSDCSVSSARAPRRNPKTKAGEVPFWNSDDIRLRSNAPRVWVELCNGECRRRPIMHDLRDHLSEPDSRQTPAVGENCCDGPGCGPALSAARDAWSIAAVNKILVRRPTRRSKKKYGILVALEKWVTERSAAYSNSLGLWCAEPNVALMSERTTALLATALGNDRVREHRPRSLSSADSFRALVPVQEWMQELRGLLRWHANLDIDDLVEQLRVDAREWAVFRWNDISKKQDDDVVATAAVASDIARREAQLAASRREQRTREEELEQAMLELERLGTSQELRDRIEDMTKRTQTAREQSENLEYFLAAFLAGAPTRELEQPFDEGSSAHTAQGSSRAGGNHDVVGGDRDVMLDGRPKTPDVAIGGKRPRMTPRSGRLGKKKKAHKRVETSAAASDNDAVRNDGSTTYSPTAKRGTL